MLPPVGGLALPQPALGVAGPASAAPLSAPLMGLPGGVFVMLASPRLPSRSAPPSVADMLGVEASPVAAFAPLVWEAVPASCTLAHAQAPAPLPSARHRAVEAAPPSHR